MIIFISHHSSTEKREDKMKSVESRLAPTDAGLEDDNASSVHR